MKYKASIDIMPLKSLLDPQGKTVGSAMNNVGFSEVSNVRIGKHISLEIESENEDIAKKKIDEVCKKILCNQIMESYTFKLEEI